VARHPGKICRLLLACGLALVAFYLFFGVISGSREHHWPVLNYLQAMWMQWLMLGIVAAMVLLGSVVFAAPLVQFDHFIRRRGRDSVIGWSSEQGRARSIRAYAHRRLLDLFSYSSFGMV